MNPLVVVTDGVLVDIERLVAAHAPERGGALLGPVGQDVVSRFVYDSNASTSGTTFSPSRQLRQEVNEIETNDHTLELKGMLHSHPGAMNRPSSGDLVAYADSLRGAPWLGRFVCPIVTAQPPAQPHELPLRSGRVSMFVAEPTHDGKADVRAATVRILPVDLHAAGLSRVLGGPDATLTTVEVDGQVYLAVLVEQQAASFQALLPAGYPTDAPLLLVTRTGDSRPATPLAERLCGDLPVGQTRQVPLAWDLGVEDDIRLVTAIQGLAEPPAERTRAEGPALAGSGPEPGPATPPFRPSPAVTSGPARTGIRERLVDMTSPLISGRRVVVVGAGSGGSQTTELLARSGVEDFVLVDADDVSAANLSRSVYVLADTGRPKVEALADRVGAINPDARCVLHRSRVQDMDKADLDALVSSADLVVAATDDPGAQRILNHFAYARGVPAVFAGMYARGSAGEVVFTVPGLTGCYRCATSSRHGGAEASPGTDYGTGRLHGEPALGADISHVVTASVKLAIGLLQVEDDDSNSSRDLLVEALTADRNYLILSTVPAWGFFGEIFAETPGQLAYQSVWLATARDAGCPVCGESPTDPQQTSIRAPRTAMLSRLRRARPDTEGRPRTLDATNREGTR